MTDCRDFVPQSAGVFHSDLDSVFVITMSRFTIFTV